MYIKKIPFIHVLNIIFPVSTLKSTECHILNMYNSFLFYDFYAKRLIP